MQGRRWPEGLPEPGWWLAAPLALLVLLAVGVLAFALRRGAGLTPAQLEPTPSPTATSSLPPTPSPAPSPTPRPPPTATPTPPPPTTCPFRGEEPEDPLALLRRPILVRLGNSAPERPHSGLLQADVVVESLSEGRITRLDALYQCREAELVGNVRSARLINLELTAMWQAILAYSGASQPVQQRIWDSGLYEVGAWPTEKGYFRVSFRPSPYNMYTSTADIRGEAQAKDYPLELEAPLAGWAYADQPPQGGEPHLQGPLIPYADWSEARYQYLPQEGVYQRYQVGTLAADAQTGEPLNVANVLVLWVEHQVTDIIEDSLGSRSLLIDLNGRGRARLFRDGQAYEAEWLRLARDQPLQVVEPGTSRPLPLRPGQTWIQVVPLDLVLR